jgi:hypothetical protein
MVPVNAYPHTQQNFSGKYPHFSTLSQERSPAVLGRKYFMNIGLKKRQIISQPGLATCLGPALESCSYLINWLFGLLTIFPPTVRHTFSSCVLSAYLPRKTENYLYIKYVNTYRHHKRDNEALFNFHYTTTFKNLLFRRALFHDTLKCGYISTSKYGWICNRC